MSWREILAHNARNSRSPAEMSNCVNCVQDSGDQISSDLAEAVEDLAEHFAERAAILEYDAHLPRDQAERHAAAMTATLARNRGYAWRALRLALPGHLVEGLPDTLEPVDRLAFGAPKLAVLPGRRVVAQGRVQR